MYCYVSAIFIGECSCFLMVARYVRLIVYGCTNSLTIAYSYSVTWSNNHAVLLQLQILQLWSCNGTTTASREMGPSGEALWKLTENHPMPWCFLLLFQQCCWKCLFLKGSQVHETSFNASFVATVSTERYRFDFSLFGLVGLLCAGMFPNRLSLSSTHFIIAMLHEQLRFHIRSTYFCITPGK